ncbi:nucleoside transporter [Xenococcus sp. PCC 7305]|uniref:NupC/NupG family nucleoside CNT transporter n=1 Tax=Xenococcus sp. PCC 7305 TaxID=102125 RepID=UPI0002AC131E|nr:NupC/NupG family nucleoside CNT transporter [Xenococcus sp. PCC 7305]ELS01301.1 nucleoside transporter [Xenococcus sp. PCC 7305]
MSDRFISLLGLLVFIGIGYLGSNNRRAVRWNTVLWGVGLQLLLGVIILKTQFGLAVFQFLGNLVSQFLDFSDAGAKLVFGDGFTEHFIAFKILPTIIFFSAFISLLYYYNILPRIVAVMGWGMMRLMKTSGAESLSCAANIFVGSTESPLMIKPYLPELTRSELHAVMTGGFATIAGGVMAAYISFGIPAEHLISASVMSAPAALAISKLFYPETEKPQTRGKVLTQVEQTATNAIDAITTGTLDGLKLALNVGAMLIAFLGLLALVNAILGWLGSQVGLPALSLEWILSYLMFPVAWLMGVPIADCQAVAVLLGKKVIISEFVAYLDLKELIASSAISLRAQVISTYALCGFSNIGSIGIIIGGISAIAPSRQSDLARLGVRALIAGSIACFMTACITGMLL